MKHLQCIYNSFKVIKPFTLSLLRFPLFTFRLKLYYETIIIINFISSKKNLSHVSINSRSYVKLKVNDPINDNKKLNSLSFKQRTS